MRSLKIFCAALLSAALSLIAVPVAYAMPSEDDIAASKNQEKITTQSIADIKVQLAQLSAHSAELNQESEKAQQAFDEAVRTAEQAQKEADEAQKQAESAQKSVDEARASMGAIAQAIYRDSSGNLGSAYYLVNADSLLEAASRDHAMDMVATHTDQQLQEFRALQDVAKNLHKRAAEKSKKQKDLMQKADVAADKAAQAAAAAQAEVEDTQSEREGLEAQLAEQQANTQALEKDRAQGLAAQEAARKKAEEEARAKAEAEARKQAEEAAKAAAAAAGAQANQAQPSPQASSNVSIDRSKPILDISSWQLPSAINYDALAASVSGVIIRIGYTGTYSGSSYNKDESFERHYAEFTKRGIPVGVYWYSCANAGSEGAAEAQKALQFLGGRHLDFPVYIDVEDPTHQLPASMSTLTAQTQQFISTVRSGGYTAGVYSSSSWYSSKLNYSALVNSGAKIWVAQWSVNPPSIAYGMWQYSSSGHLNGYSGRLDVNQLG